MRHLYGVVNLAEGDLSTARRTQHKLPAEWGASSSVLGTAGQNERLAITYGVNLGLRVARPALADARQALPRRPLLQCPSPPPASRRRLPRRWWPLPLRRLRAVFATATPELLIVYVFHLRSGLLDRASSLP